MSCHRAAAATERQSPLGVRELARRLAFERLAASPVRNCRQVAGVNGVEQARAIAATKAAKFFARRQGTKPALCRASAMVLQC